MWWIDFYCLGLSHRNSDQRQQKSHWEEFVPNLQRTTKQMDLVLSSVEGKVSTFASKERVPWFLWQGKKNAWWCAAISGCEVDLDGWERMGLVRIFHQSCWFFIQIKLDGSIQRWSWANLLLETILSGEIRHF